MYKTWLFLIPLLFSLLSCEGFTTTGSNDPYSNPCYGISKKNAYSYMFFFELNCPYGDVCKTKLSFLGSGVGDTLDGRCFSEYVLNLITNDSSMFAHSGKRYLLALTPDNHAKFTFVDEDNVEKKYDIDLSGIVNSYTVHGDSVDVNVMKNCMIYVYTTPRNTEIYGNQISNSLYSFAMSDSRENWMSYDCQWNGQGPLMRDDLNIHARLYWK